MNENQQFAEISQQLADIAKEQTYLRGAFDQMNERSSSLEGAHDEHREPNDHTRGSVR